MIHWWRSSLATQFIGFMLLALVISQIITFLVSWDERSQALHAAVKSEFFSRSATLTRLIETLQPDLRQSVLSSSETSYSRFWLSDRDETDALAWRRRAVAELSRPLDNFVDLGRSYGFQTKPPGTRIRDDELAAANAGQSWTTPTNFLWNQPQEAKFLYFDGRNGYGLTVKIADGVWLNCASYKADNAFWWNSRTLTSLAITASVLSLIGIFIARRITRPLRRLAASAEALGRGENLPALPEDGPDDVKATTVAFNRMQERLHRFVEDRTRMLAAIGHDLRTPLTSLRLRAEFVKDPGIRDKMVATIDELQTMTEAAIAFARGEVNVEETRTIDLQALVGSICDDLADIGQSVTFMEAQRTTYRCRPEGLRRAVRNLAENATRYAGHAVVSVRHTGSSIDIVIEDNGPGVPEAMREKVFAPFFRLEASRNRETGGVGLGLSIARAVARQHGGDVVLTSNNPGLCAVISLPREGFVEAGGHARPEKSSQFAARARRKSQKAGVV